ncbi:MAG: acylphosphatase [Phycisphaerales bacterium]|nr:acylphosphatase [Phycisphaerales bacterium]
METVRRQVFFSGNVQGVGFRHTTRCVADRFEVTGFVRNLPDGRVELIAEGRSDQVGAFIAAVEQAMSGNIRHAECVASAATSEFERFRVHH